MEKSICTRLWPLPKPVPIPLSTGGLYFRWCYVSYKAEWFTSAKLAMEMQLFKISQNSLVQQSLPWYCNTFPFPVHPGWPPPVSVSTTTFTAAIIHYQRKRLAKKQEVKGLVTSSQSQLDMIRRMKPKAIVMVERSYAENRQEHSFI